MHAYFTSFPGCKVLVSSNDAGTRKYELSYTDTRTYTYICKDIYLNIDMNIYIYIYIHTCICTHTYRCTYTHAPNLYMYLTNGSSLLLRLLWAAGGHRRRGRSSRELQPQEPGSRSPNRKLSKPKSVISLRRGKVGSTIGLGYLKQALSCF